MLNDNAIKKTYNLNKKMLKQDNASHELCWQSKTKTMDQTKADQDSKSKM